MCVQQIHFRLFETNIMSKSVTTEYKFVESIGNGVTYKWSYAHMLYGCLCLSNNELLCLLELQSNWLTAAFRACTIVALCRSHSNVMLYMWSQQ